MFQGYLRNVNSVTHHSYVLHYPSVVTRFTTYSEASTQMNVVSQKDKCLIEQGNDHGCGIKSPGDGTRTKC